MIIVVAGLLAVLSPALTGGDLRRLAQLRLRAVWLVFLALAVQFAITVVLPHANHVVLSVLHVLSYVLAGVFVVANRHVPGLLLTALGAASNGVTIAINGGTLPASAAALREAGLPVSANGFVNSGVLAHPRLPFLGDIFALPSSVPLANVFSVGDVLIVVGVAWGSHRICGSHLLPPSRRGLPAAASRLAPPDPQPVAPTPGAGAGGSVPAVHPHA
jgi:hypothetical protein